MLWLAIIPAAGRDDVHLLHFRSGGMLHVDQFVFEHVQEQQQIQKAAWSRQLRRDGQTLALDFSRDFRGMQYAMPGILLVFLVTAIWSARAARHPSIDRPQDDLHVSPV